MRVVWDKRFCASAIDRLRLDLNIAQSITFGQRIANLRFHPCGHTDLSLRSGFQSRKRCRSTVSPRCLRSRRSDPRPEPGKRRIRRRWSVADRHRIHRRARLRWLPRRSPCAG
ncbi:hypothetical protein RHECNPAF_770088 [Rhizobium etli CNPAF512]|nr:hypothetical protein RHECNPAF_770088 [Rhizobium etli CNPAF512]